MIYNSEAQWLNELLKSHNLQNNLKPRCYQLPQYTSHNRVGLSLENYSSWKDLQETSNDWSPWSPTTFAAPTTNQPTTKTTMDSIFFIYNTKKEDKKATSINWVWLFSSLLSVNVWYFTHLKFNPNATLIISYHHRVKLWKFLCVYFALM